MKALICLLFLTISTNTFAQASHELSEAEQLGTVAGLALACNAQKLNDFELIASRILANEASTDEQEMVSAREYAAAKFTAQRRHKNNPQMSCSDILSHFNHLPIFNSVVYSDGSVKMFDGSWLKPQRPAPTIQKAKGKPKNAAKPTQSSVRSR